MEILINSVELLRLFEERKSANQILERKNNARLPAGSPMYFYCKECGAEIEVPENYETRPHHCPPCLTLKENGLIE